MPIMEVLDTGPLTTIQDNGRFGLRAFGVSQSGPMDQLALIWQIYSSDPQVPQQLNLHQTVGDFGLTPILPWRLPALGSC